MKYLISFLVLGFLLTIVIPFSLAQEPPRAPGTLEEAKTLGESILKNFPEVLKKSWQEALAVWGKMLNWLRDRWYSYILSWFQNIWQKINSFLGKEVEKRKPEIKEEFEKEKQEMKEDIPKVGKSLWERLKELIR